MEKDSPQELIKELEAINKNLKRIADALSVFKVTLLAFIIGALIVIVKNFMQ